VWLELHPAGLQRLERRLAVLHLEGVDHGTLSGRARCAWPLHELGVLAFDADRQESRPVDLAASDKPLTRFSRRRTAETTD
jgi:hypothetical protein